MNAGFCPAWNWGRSAVRGGGEGAGGGEARPAARSVPLQELEDLQKELPKYLRHLCSAEDNVLVWHALLLPVSVCGPCWDWTT